MRVWRGWLPLVVLPPAVVVLTPAAWPRWVFMWILAAVIFLGCKWLTWRRCGAENVPIWRHVTYLFVWPGLDAPAFLTGSSPAPQIQEWLKAVAFIVSGAVLLFGVVRRIEQPMLAGWIGMVGLIQVLHFGSLHLISCFWRALGIQAKPLMNAPIRAENLSEFWGQRWNTAFRDLTHRFLFRPLMARVGASRALALGFLFSGLIHDAVISIPAGGGYGGPTIFFLIQGGAIFIERSSAGRKAGLGHGWRGWAFTMAILIAPACLLFHPPFVYRVILPFMGTIGAR